MDRLVVPEPESSLTVDKERALSPEPSTGGSVIVKEGWLQGRCPTLGKENASLKRRFFVLEPTRMIWYDCDASWRSSDLPAAPVGEMSLDPETQIFTDSLAKGQLCVQGFCRTLVGESGEALHASSLEHQTKGKLVLKSASPQEARDWASMLAAQVDRQAPNPNPNPNSNPNPNPDPNPNLGPNPNPNPNPNPKRRWTRRPLPTPSAPAPPPSRAARHRRPRSERAPGCQRSSLGGRSSRLGSPTRAPAILPRRRKVTRAWTITG